MKRQFDNNPLGVIPAVSMSDEAFDKMMEEILAITPIVEHWATMLGNGESNMRRFRAAYCGSCKNLSVGEKLIIHSIPKEDRQKIDRLRSFEYPLIQHFVLMIAQQAIIYARSCAFRVSPEDLVQEGHFVLFECLFSYTSMSKFGTYLTWALRNRFKRVVSEQRDTIPRAHPTILARVYQIQKMQHDYQITFDEAVLKIGLSDGEILTVLRAMASSVEINENFDAPEAEEEADEFEIDPLMEAAYQTADLTPFERDLCESKRDEVKGGLSAVARRTINPSTGQPYTRARAGQVFKIAQRKVIARYKELKHPSLTSIAA